MSIRVLLVDDHRMMLEGLRLILSQESDVQIVGEASCGREAVRMAAQLKPDLVIMDVSMPDMNGMEATREICRQCPQVRVIALSTYASRRYVLGMLEAGAAGYVVKAATPEELVQAVRAVMLGKRYLSAEVGGVLAEQYVGRQGELKGARLGLREQEVLCLIARGYSSKDIAGQLHLSTRTVETHRRNIMLKLDLHNVADLTRYALRIGLVTLEE